MKDYEEIKAGMILYTARTDEEFWDTELSSSTPNGVLPQYTKIIVDYIDGSDVYFKVLEGEFNDRLFMWTWFGESTAQPEELLTQEEYDLVVKKSPMWKLQISKVQQCPQRQDSLTDQMIDLYAIANKFGFYDAADLIRQKYINN